MSLASSSASEITLLAASSIFAMSLGAKELFHTNFLAFLLESEDPSLQAIQVAIRQALNFAPQLNAVPQCAVWREKNNLDLVIVELEPLKSTITPSNHKSIPTSSSSEVEESGEKTVGSADWDWNPDTHWTNYSSNVAWSGITATGNAGHLNPTSSSILVPTGRILIVEVKLKSIPGLPQLINYDNKISSTSIDLKFPEDSESPDWHLRFGLKNTLKIMNGKSTTLPIILERRLLSITGFSMTTPATSARPSKCWAGVSWKALQLAMTGSIPSPAPSPLISVIDDYARSLGALITLIDRAYQVCDDARILPAVPPYRAMRSQTQDYRFKSLRINDLLGKALFDHWLNNHVLNKLSGLTVPPGWSLRSYAYYSRGVPGFGIELVNDQFQMPPGNIVELKIGIQVQNKDLRLSISSNPGFNALEAWVAQHKANLLDVWFSHTAFPKSVPRGKESKPVQQLTPPAKGRRTNLMVFDVNRFLYSAIDIDSMDILAIEVGVFNLMTQAYRLAPLL